MDKRWNKLVNRFFYIFYLKICSLRIRKLQIAFRINMPNRVFEFKPN